MVVVIFVVGGGGFVVVVIGLQCPIGFVDIIDVLGGCTVWNGKLDMSLYVVRYCCDSSLKADILANLPFCNVYVLL